MILNIHLGWCSQQHNQSPERQDGFVLSPGRALPWDKLGERVLHALILNYALVLNSKRKREGMGASKCSSSLKLPFQSFLDIKSSLFQLWQNSQTPFPRKTQGFEHLSHEFPLCFHCHSPVKLHRTAPAPSPMEQSCSLDSIPSQPNPTDPPAGLSCPCSLCP